MGGDPDSLQDLCVADKQGQGKVCYMEFVFLF